MKILYKLTTRSRPDKMFAAIQNIRATALEKDPWIIVTLDANDRTCHTEEIKNKLILTRGVDPRYGRSKNKIEL